MVTNNHELEPQSATNEINERLSKVDLISGFNPLDMARLSIEHSAQIQKGTTDRFLKSIGQIHVVEGDGDNHQADLVNVSRLISSFQSLVTSIGGSLKGHKTVRGKMPYEIVQDTALTLDSSPIPGSVILIISPQRLPAEELESENMALFDRKTEQLIDLVFPKLSLLFDDMVSLPENPHQELDPENSTLAMHLRDLGPRVASSLRRFSGVTASSNFSVDISWSQPHQSTMRTKKLIPSIANRASNLISNSETDEETVEIEGTMRTVSDIEQLAISPIIGGGKTEKTIHLKGTNLPAGALKGIDVGSHVTISATVTRLAETMDGRSAEKFDAKSIKLIQ